MGEAPHYREESLAVSSLEHSTELVVVHPAGAQAAELSSLRR
jgi:hypothetical protein